MAGEDHLIDRWQLGEFAAEIRVLREAQVRQVEAIEGIRATVGLIQIQLGRIDAERRMFRWIGGIGSAIIAAIAGAFAGHFNVPPAAH